MGSGRWDNLRPKLHPKASKFRQQFALKSLPNSGSQRKHQCLCFDVWPQKGEPPFRPGEARKGPSLHCLQVYTKRALILMHNAYSWLLSLALLPEPTAPNIAGPFLCICVYVYVPVPMCVCVCVSAAVIMQQLHSELRTRNSSRSRSWTRTSAARIQTHSLLFPYTKQKCAILSSSKNTFKYS